MSHELLSSASVRPARLGDHHRADLARAQALVVTADLTTDPATRYLAAHHALREVAALALRARTGRAVRGASNAGLSSNAGLASNAGLWRLVAHHAPELAEWAGYLSAIQPRHDAVARGELPIGDREADDLVRDAQTFLEAVGRLRLAPGGRR